jgi:fatty-acid desaturase
MNKMSPYVTKVFLPMHLLGVIALTILITQFSWWMLPAIWLGWFVTGCLGAEIGLHRLYSHKAFPVRSKAVRWVIGWASCMSGQWSPVFWAALHRGYHHQSGDTPRDIHSPVNGNWHAFVGWYFTLKDNDVRLSYARDLIRDPMHVFLHKHYMSIFWVSILVLWLVMGTKLFLIATVIPVLLAMYQENLVNLVCHKNWFGYRNFDTNDKSVNIYPLGLIIWGQGFHNNHHAKPSNYDFGVKPSEIDLCRWVVPSIMWVDRRFHA